MFRHVVIIGMMQAGALGAEAPVVLPSGLEISAREVVFEPAGVQARSARTLRLRYVAPDLRDVERFPFDVIEADFELLCRADGLSIVSKSAPNTEQIIISLASEGVALGETAPEVVQYFEAFRPEGASCVWDGF